MALNPAQISTLTNGLTTDGIIDGSDKLHSGILKALYSMSMGSYVVSCNNFTESTAGAFTSYTLGAEIVYAVNGDYRESNTDMTVAIASSADATYPRYDWIYIDTDDTLKVREGTISGSTSLVSDLDLGEVPIAIVEIAAGSADNAAHNVQMLMGMTELLQQQVTKIKARTGVAITAGDALYVYDNHNANTAIVDIADASDSSKMPVIGLAKQDLASQEEGFAVVFGLLKGIDTVTDFDSSDVGGTVYVASGGGLTPDKPTGASDLIQNVGILTRYHGSSGVIFVTGIGRTNDVPNLAFVTADSSGLANGRQLNAGTGITVTDNGAGSTIDITNTAPDQTVTLTDGTGITTSGTYPNFTITNSAPDQTVSLTGGGITAITGSYPNFTITSTEADTLDSVVQRGPSTSNSITVGGLTDTGVLILSKQAANGTSFTPGPLLNYSLYVNEPSNAIVMPDAAAHDGMVVNIKNVGAAALTITPFAGNTFENAQHPLSDQRVVAPNTISLEVYESITLQALTDAVSPLTTGWYIHNTDIQGASLPSGLITLEYAATNLTTTSIYNTGHTNIPLGTASIGTTSPITGVVTLPPDPNFPNTSQGFIVVEDGTYIVEVRVSLSGWSPTTSNFYQSRWVLNTALQNWDAGGEIVGGNGRTLRQVVTLSAGDELGVTTYQNSGSTKNTNTAEMLVFRIN